MKPFEFWHPRVFEAPYYVYLLLRCLRHGLPVKYLAKANYALDHGELGLGSKYSTQMAFAQDRFPPTDLLDGSLTASERQARITAFARAHGYPLILKPDIGAVGKGILKLDDDHAAGDAARAVQGNHLLQGFVPFSNEYGVFFVRKGGVSQITGINKKHFPAVVGNGRDSIGALARRHYRYTNHWNIFLKYVDVERVPDADETVRLSFIGSHTMGCKFTDDAYLKTGTLEDALFTFCQSQAGFNFGRLDVKSTSDDALKRGEFAVLEVNGIASLPTHMFDPDNSLLQAYRTFLAHGKHLVDIANENRERPMVLKPYREIWQLAKRNHSTLNDLHRKAMAT